MEKFLIRIAIGILSRYFDLIFIGKDPENRGMVASIYFADSKYKDQLIEDMRQGRILHELKKIRNNS